MVKTVSPKVLLQKNLKGMKNYNRTTCTDKYIFCCLTYFLFPQAICPLLYTFTLTDVSLITIIPRLKYYRCI